MLKLKTIKNNTLQKQYIIVDYIQLNLNHLCIINEMYWGIVSSYTRVISKELHTLTPT